MWHEYAARANAHYHRPDDRLSFCDLHETWFDEDCPVCAVEEVEGQHDHVLIEAGEP